MVFFITLEKKEKEDMILLANKKLACSGPEFNMDKVIFYGRKVPYLEIIKILRKYEEKQVAEDIERLKNIEVAFEGMLLISRRSPENTMSFSMLCLVILISITMTMPVYGSETSLLMIKH